MPPNNHNLRFFNIFILIHLIKGIQINLNHQQQTILSISKTLNYSFDVITYTQFLYLQIHSCDQPSYILSYNDSRIVPYYQISQLAAFYNVNKSRIKLYIHNDEDIRQDYTIKFISMQNINNYFPQNNFDVNTSQSLQFFTISFQPLLTLESNKISNYSIWLVQPAFDIDCSIYSNILPNKNSGIIYITNISSNQKINIDIPMSGQYLNKNQYLIQFINYFAIKNFIINNRVFYVNVYLNGSKPYNYTLAYNKAYVNKRDNIQQLQGGFIIFFSGILIFLSVSCIYTYCKRKYKHQQQFEQEIEVQIQASAYNGHNRIEKKYILANLQTMVSPLQTPK